MDRKEILSHVDHTLLAPDSTWAQIEAICDDAYKFGTASVCIPPSFVKRAASYLEGAIKVCTVIGFPLGYSSASAKVEEAKKAIHDGVDEIDMVINIGHVKMGMFDEVLSEIKAIRAACDSAERKIVLKVIIETCLLTDSEKIKMCEIVTEAGADYIKTSTGFSTGGATREDIALFAAHVGEGVKIKAAGGISSFDDAEDFLALGADRLGTSRLVKLAKNENPTEKY